MLLRQIEYFAAVVKCGSFTEAAEACYVSQSAISQQIQTLERDLGVPLLVREGRRFSLTPAGQAFYRRSLSVLQEAALLRQETFRAAQGEGAALCFGYPIAWNGPQIRQAVAAQTRQADVQKEAKAFVQRVLGR